MVPWRNTCTPPALVDTSPPMVALPLAPSDSGKTQPCASAAAWTVSRIAPASATSSSEAASMLRIPFIRDRLSSTLPPSGAGMPPPTSPVLPPCGTSPTRWYPAAATIAATAAVERGISISGVTPWNLPRQSTRCGAMISGSSVQSSPAACIKAAMAAGGGMGIAGSLRGTAGSGHRRRQRSLDGTIDRCPAVALVQPVFKQDLPATAR